MTIRSLLLATLFMLAAALPAQAGDALSGEALASLVDQLELSAEQRAEVSSLIARYAKKAEALREESQQLRRDMQGQSLSAINRKSIATMSRRAGAVAARHTGEILRTQRDFYRLLTSEQQAEYRRLREVGSQQDNTAR